MWLRRSRQNRKVVAYIHKYRKPSTYVPDPVFQSRAIDDIDNSAISPDEAACLQILKGDCDTRTAYGHHGRELLVCQRQLSTIKAILRDNDEISESLLNRALGVYRRRLSELQPSNI